MIPLAAKTPKLNDKYRNVETKVCFTFTNNRCLMKQKSKKETENKKKIVNYVSKKEKIKTVTKKNSG